MWCNLSYLIQICMCPCFKLKGFALPFNTIYQKHYKIPPKVAHLMLLKRKHRWKNPKHQVCFWLYRTCRSWWSLPCSHTQCLGNTACCYWLCMRVKLSMLRGRNDIQLISFVFMHQKKILITLHILNSNSSPGWQSKFSNVPMCFVHPGLM